MASLTPDPVDPDDPDDADDGDSVDRYARKAAFDRFWRDLTPSQQRSLLRLSRNERNLCTQLKALREHPSSPLGDDE